MKKAATRKRTLRPFIAILLVIALAVGGYAAAHWLSTADGNHREALARQAARYFGEPVPEVLAVETRGGYLALLYTKDDGSLGMCEFDRDSLFPGRWRANGGTERFPRGELVSWNYGSPDGEAVLIFCGAGLPETAEGYTFQNGGVTYTCPVENGTVLDIFVIPDSEDIQALPVLLGGAASQDVPDIPEADTVPEASIPAPAGIVAPDIPGIPFRYVYRGFSAVDFQDRAAFQAFAQFGTKVIATEADWSDFMARFCPGIPYDTAFDFSTDYLLASVTTGARPGYASSDTVTRLSWQDGGFALEYENDSANYLYALNTEAAAHFYVEVLAVRRENLPAGWEPWGYQPMK